MIAEKIYTAEKIENQNNELTQAEIIALISSALSKNDTKKETTSIEYKYVFREITPGHIFHWDYRKEGSILFNWTGEYWKEQAEEFTKNDISKWLEKEHSTKFTSKNLSSIFTMFMATVKNFENTKITETIISTKKHWLLIDDKTGDITAINPDKNKPIRYQIDMVIEKAGQYILPKREKLFPPNKKAYFHDFIKSSLSNMEKRNLVQEYAGYSLTNSVRKQVFQVYIGDGANGKSVFVECLTKVHGQPVAVNIENVHEYNNHLIGASLIYCTETSKKGFDQEFVKQAVTGDKIELRGIYSKKQNAYLSAKWIMLMNSMPHISDFSNGLFRRMQIIEWDKQFNGKNGNPEPIEDLAKLIIENEKDEFLIWCLQGLQRLIKNNWKFTICEDAEKSLENWKNTADKIRMFASEYNYKYSIDKKEHTSKNKIFEYFCKWATENNFEKVNSTTFWTRMANIYPEIKNDTEKKIEGQRIVYLKAQPS